MVVMDVFTRRIIGFGVERVDPCGASICRMFNQIIQRNKSTLHKLSFICPIKLSQDGPSVPASGR
jgi:hypothetical protein